MDANRDALLTDLYQLNMLQAYLDHGMTGTAVFELFVRTLPGPRRFLMAAGLEPALDFLERLRFEPEDLEWLRSTGRFRENLLSWLEAFRFGGEVHALPEGTVFFPHEPVLRVTAPLPEAQLVESRLLNLLHLHTVLASKAARMVLAARGKLLVDFGFRRAHGAEAGLAAARASYLAGFAGSATVLAGTLGVPISGTMAHSFVQAHETEEAAWESFARSRPDDATLLIDSYDVVAAARKVAELAPKLVAEGIDIRAVRIDSGDLVALARTVRGILDEAGLARVSIFASGGLDEHDVERIVREGAPIDGFGIGTSLATASDAPALDCAYKLVEYAGAPKRKRSSGKATWPGRKQLWRRYGPDGRLAGDVLGLEGEEQPGEPLVVPVMRAGRRLVPPAALAALRAHAAANLARLPDALRRLEPGESLRVEVAPALERLAAEADRRLREAEEREAEEEAIRDG